MATTQRAVVRSTLAAAVVDDASGGGSGDAGLGDAGLGSLGVEGGEPGAHAISSATAPDP